MTGLGQVGELRSVSTGETLAAEAELAEGFRALLVGLIGQPSVPRDYALGLAGCDQVHTFGVRFPIDVIYCDKQGRVIGVEFGLPPCRIAPRARNAAIVWEAAAGQFEGRVRLGDRLSWSTDIKTNSSQIAG